MSSMKTIINAIKQWSENKFNTLKNDLNQLDAEMQFKQPIGDYVDRSEVYTKDKVYTKDEVYSKDEVYAKDEVYDGLTIDGQLMVDGQLTVDGSIKTYGIEIGDSASAVGRSFAVGLNARAIGTSSQAVGSETTASGSCSHAEGGYTTASDYYSHAEGHKTTASAFGSHAEGFETIASGEYSHAEGSGTIAASDDQHVQGRHNIEDADGKYLHIVGNGWLGNPANAHTLDWGGNAWFAGGLKVGGTGQDDENAVEVALKTDVPTTLDNLHPATTADAKKILMVQSDGKWSMQALETEEWTFTLDDGTEVVKNVVVL